MVIDEDVKDIRVKLYRGKFVVTTYTRDEEKIKLALQNWYREKTQIKAKERIRYYEGDFSDFDMRSELSEIAGKPLETRELNDVLKSVNQNLYIKDYTRYLVPPRGKKGIQFKENEIKPFLKNINEDVEKYLISELGVESLDHIPSIAYKLSITLVRDFYTLSDELKKEYDELTKKLTDIRQEVIMDNQKKNNILYENFKGEISKVRSVIKGLLK